MISGPPAAIDHWEGEISLSVVLCVYSVGSPTLIIRVFDVQSTVLHRHCQPCSPARRYGWCDDDRAEKVHSTYVRVAYVSVKWVSLARLAQVPSQTVGASLNASNSSSTRCLITGMNLASEVMGSKPINGIESCILLSASNRYTHRTLWPDERLPVSHTKR